MNWEQRELKFRAWTGERWFADAYGTTCYPGLEMYGLPRDAIITQWTGLVDSEGVEIYEGDVVEGQWVHEESIFPHGLIRWYNSSWWIDWFTGPDHDWLGEYIPEELKVIGNVFEHPELLEEEQ
jgi:hypothetical protein